MSSPKFTVAICGGGVGGLVLAVALAKYRDIQVEVYEAAKQFSDIGAGVGMWPRTWRIMKLLGLDQELAKVALVPPLNIPNIAFTMRKGDEPIGRTFDDLVTPGGMITFHRPDFQRVLLTHLSATSCRLHTRKRLVAYEYDNSHVSEPNRSAIQIQFEDGTSATCDVLVGADGIKSRVRTKMLGQLASDLEASGSVREAQAALSGMDPVWSGHLMYRTTYPAEDLEQHYRGHRALHQPMIYLGRDAQITAYPIARGTRVNVAAACVNWDLENTPFYGPWVQDIPRQEVGDVFSRWEAEAQALLRCSPIMSRWAIHTIRPLNTFVFGRIALLGDAAHAMLPYQGSGAGQAVEDALILATALGHSYTSRRTIPRALKMYDTIRRPFAQAVAQKSRDNGLLFTLNHSNSLFNAFAQQPADDNTLMRLQVLRNQIRANWEWAWNTTIDADVERVSQLLAEQES